MTSLATPVQLGAFIQQAIAVDDPTALLLLDIASDVVRDHLNLQLDLHAGDVVVLDPINGEFVFLPELPISAITLVETFDGTVWTTAPATSYTASLDTGQIQALAWMGVSWPSKPGTWRVTYSHGFATIPSGLVGVVLGVAARAYTSPAGISQEAVGGYSVRYEIEKDGFTALEEVALDRYALKRVG
jgi:hypothetical protein